MISDEAVDAGVLFTDTMDQLKRSFSAMATGIGASVFPIVQQFAEFIIANMPMIQEVLGNVMNSLGEAVSAVLPFLMDLIQKRLPSDDRPIFADSLRYIAASDYTIYADITGGTAAVNRGVYGCNYNHITAFRDLLTKLSRIFCHHLYSF